MTILLLLSLFLLPSSASSSTLYEAIVSGDAAAVDSLLRSGAMPDALLWNRGRPAGYPLSLAIQLGQSEAVRLLLAAGADPDHPPTLPPLQTAIKRGDPQMVRALLARGADREKRDRSGETPLFTVARQGSETIATILLGFGADTGALADNGSTPIEAAVRSGNLSVAEVLLRSGVSLDTRAVRAAVQTGNADWSPVRVYLEREREERVRFVCEHVVHSRSYSEVARFLRREPDVPCRRALEARLGGFVRERVQNFRLVPWTGEERILPATTGKVRTEFPMDGPEVLAEAERASCGPLRVRHLHGPTNLRRGDFLLIEAKASVPGTDIRADATILHLKADGDDFIAAESMDQYGLWTLNDLALIPVGTEIRVRGSEPIHIFGLDILGGSVRIAEEGMRIGPGTTLFKLPW